MNTPTKTATAKPLSPSEGAQSGARMQGCDILIAALEREGVEAIFAYPGGASMEFHQSLTRSKIRTILPRHEQGGAFAAEGYARACGKPGVCMATSGPGATNLVTGIADAYMDSIPLIAITGQVPQAMIGKGAFQETDIFGVTLTIVKHSYLVTDITDLPRIVKEAFCIARSGRPGRVFIGHPNSRHHHHHGLRCFSGNRSAFTEVFGHARQCLCELGRQWRTSHRQARSGFAPRIRCPLRRPRHRQSGKVLRTRNHRPYRRRCLRNQQE